MTGLSSNLLAAAAFAVGCGVVSVSVYVMQEPAPPAPVEIVQPKIDENLIASLVADKIIAAEDERIAAAKATAKRADCQFWGPRMAGCK